MTKNYSLDPSPPAPNYDKGSQPLSDSRFEAVTQAAGLHFLRTTRAADHVPRHHSPRHNESVQRGAVFL